jgi:hypothetical protein
MAWLLASFTTPFTDWAPEFAENARMQIAVARS